MAPEFFYVCLGLVVITSSARLTRLATHDKFPPVRWLRDKYDDLMDARAITRSWVLLAHCGYCAAPWFTAFVVVWAYLVGVTDGPSEALSGAQTAWWLVNGVLGASYLAAILMANDGDIGEQE